MSSSFYDTLSSRLLGTYLGQCGWGVGINPNIKVENKNPEIWLLKKIGMKIKLAKCGSFSNWQNIAKKKGFT